MHDRAKSAPKVIANRLNAVRKSLATRIVMALTACLLILGISIPAEAGSVPDPSGLSDAAWIITEPYTYFTGGETALEAALQRQSEAQGQGVFAEVKAAVVTILDTPAIVFDAFLYAMFPNDGAGSRW